MMSSNLSGSRRLRESALRPSSAAPSQPSGAEVLSESEEEAEEDGLPSGASDAFQSSLDKLTEILSLLTLEKTRKAKASKVDQALDSISGGAHGEVSAGGGGLKRAAAARRALRQALQDHPEDISSLLERLMLEDLTSTVQPPGVPPTTLSARGWIEHRSRIGSYRTAAYCAWSAGGIVDDLIQGRPTCTGESSPIDLTTRSNSHRPWLMDVVVRTISRTRSAIRFVGDPRSSVGERRRGSIQQTFGREVGGGLPLPPPRCRGVHHEEEGPWTQDRRCREGEGQQGRSHQQSSEGQGKGKGRDRWVHGGVMHEAVDERVDGGVVVPGCSCSKAQLSVRGPSLADPLANTCSLS